MPEVGSHFKTTSVPGGIIFLTDADVVAYYENKGHSVQSIDWNDFTGHQGIIRVFRITKEYYHHEGFIGMPPVMKKMILEGKADRIFSHCENLREATPEFIPMMRRLAVHSRNVANQLEVNPYNRVVPLNGNERNWKLSLTTQMRVGIKHGFTGSTIGNILRAEGCPEEAMLVALNSAKTRRYMDGYEDHHHYLDIVANPYTTKKVLQFLLTDVKHEDVRVAAKLRIKGPVKKATILRFTKSFRVKTVTRNGVKIRVKA
jgi:hypothetical protein